MLRRFGAFSIAAQYLKNHPHRWAEVLAYMHFLPTNVHYDMPNDAFFYVGFSTMFDEIPEGHNAPKYNIIVHESRKTGSLKSVSVERIN